MKKILFLSFFVGLNFFAVAQQVASERLIQFSGMILTEDKKQLVPVPYANVYLKNRKRGTYSDMKGFFSFVAEKGEKVVFSCVGMRTIEVTIPDTLQDNRYSVIQMMGKDNSILPELIVFPWPDREHFKIEFLAMNTNDEMRRRALENVAEKEMKRMRKELAYDGKENGQYYLREQAKQSYYVGQFRPMNIFSPLAWGQFFKDWKEGKFKKKDE